MRIIHEIEGPARVSAHVTIPPKSSRNTRQCRATVIIDVPPQAHGLIPSETIQLEGDGAFLLHALRTALAKLEDTAQTLVDAGELSGDWDKPFEENGSSPDPRYPETTETFRPGRTPLTR